MNTKPDRHIIYIPILHSEADMGTLSGAAKEHFHRKFDAGLWKKRQSIIGAMWEGLSLRVKELPLTYSETKIYQDGLPVCDHEERIIRDLAEKGSPNHRLTLWLMQQGATLVGTEDPILLTREYQHIKKILTTTSGVERDTEIHVYEKEANELLEKRDQFIAGRIRKTLGHGQTGLVLIGLLHRVDELLRDFATLTYLIYRLPFKRSFEINRLKIS